MVCVLVTLAGDWRYLSILVPNAIESIIESYMVRSDDGFYLVKDSKKRKRGWRVSLSIKRCRDIDFFVIDSAGFSFFVNVVKKRVPVGLNVDVYFSYRGKPPKIIHEIEESIMGVLEDGLLVRPEVRIDRGVSERLCKSFYPEESIVYSDTLKIIRGVVTDTFSYLSSIISGSFVVEAGDGERVVRYRVDDGVVTGVCVIRGSEYIIDYGEADYLPGKGMVTVKVYDVNGSVERRVYRGRIGDLEWLYVFEEASKSFLGTLVVRDPEKKTSIIIDPVPFSTGFIRSFTSGYESIVYFTRYIEEAPHVLLVISEETRIREVRVSERIYPLLYDMIGDQVVVPFYFERTGISRMHLVPETGDRVGIVDDTLMDKYPVKREKDEAIEKIIGDRDNLVLYFPVGPLVVLG